MIRIFTDGACTGNGTPNQIAGIGIVVEWQGRKPSIYSKHIGNKSNNEAEYLALIEALQIIKNENIRECTIHSDSNLMVQQINGNWACRDKKLIELLIKAQNRINWLKQNNYNIEVVYIKREFNLADTPAKNAKREA